MTFITVSMVAALPVVATEAQLKSVTSHSADKATTVSPVSETPLPTGSVSQLWSNAPPSAAFMKIAKPTASAACDPVFMMAKTVQP